MINSHQNFRKVVIVGDWGVGKTCLLTRFLRDEFDDNSVTTLGVSFKSKHVPYNEAGDTINLQMWDTAG